MAAIGIIEGLEPKPARNFSSSATTYIVPDVSVIKTEEGYQILFRRGLPKIRLSNRTNLCFAQGDPFKEEKLFVDKKIRSAVWLLKSLDQRNKTIYRVTECY